MYAESNKLGGKSETSFYCMPALVVATAAGNGPCRGNGVVYKDKGYIVSGNGFYEIDSSMSATIKGTIGSVSGPVYMAAGASYLMLVDGDKGYTWDGTTFGPITDPDFPANPSSCTWVDNYHIVSEGGTGRFQISDLDDPTSWDATMVATAESRPDNIQRVTRFRNGDLTIIGESSIEVYNNTGNVDFPFEPYPNTNISFGTPAPASVVETQAGIFMLVEYSNGGYGVAKVYSETPEIISTAALEWQIQNLSRKSDAEAFAYTQFGHLFYQIAFPASGRTFCYDDKTGLWQERTTGGDRHRAQGHLYYNDTHLVGDYENGNIYSLSMTDYTDNGEYIERLRRTATLAGQGQYLFVSRLEVECETGVGLVTGQGSDPKIMFRWSVDGGREWSNWRKASLGKTGEYGTIAVWNNLGRGRQFVFDIKVTDPVNVVMIRAFADIQVGV